MDWLDDILDWGSKAYDTVSSVAGKDITNGLIGAGLGQLTGSDSALRDFGYGILGGRAASAFNAPGANVPGSGATTIAGTGATPNANITSGLDGQPAASATPSGAMLSGGAGAGEDYSNEGRNALQVARGDSGVGDYSNEGRNWSVAQGATQPGTFGNLGAKIQAGLQRAGTNFGNNIVSSIPKIVTAGLQPKNPVPGAYQSMADADVATVGKQNALADRVAGTAVDPSFTANNQFARVANAGNKQVNDLMESSAYLTASPDARRAMLAQANRDNSSAAQTGYMQGMETGLNNQRAGLSTAAGMYKMAPSSIGTAADKTQAANTADTQGWGSLLEDVLSSKRNQAQDDTATN